SASVWAFGESVDTAEDDGDASRPGGAALSSTTPTVSCSTGREALSASSGTEEGGTAVPSSSLMAKVGVLSSTTAGGTSVAPSAGSCFSSGKTGEGSGESAPSASAGVALSSTTLTVSRSASMWASLVSSDTVGDGTTPSRPAVGTLSSTTPTVSFSTGREAPSASSATEGSGTTVSTSSPRAAKGMP
ncbi:unnamed protein product, partial [Ectocarpus sp. 12 AP-2014]